MARRVIDADARDGHEASIGPDILDRHRKANPTRLLLSRRRRAHSATWPDSVDFLNVHWRFPAMTITGFETEPRWTLAC
jgi:hypothetical protein